MSEAERLAAYDRMYADLLKERDKVLADMDTLCQPLSNMDARKRTKGFSIHRFLKQININSRKR